MCDTPEYKAFISCQGDLLDSIAASSESITSLAHRLNGKVLTNAVFIVATDRNSSAVDRANKILCPLLNCIKRDKNLFHFFVKQLKEVGFMMDAENLEKELSESC